MTPADEEVDIDLPFFSVHVGGGRNRVRFGRDDGEDVIDMESYDADEYRMVRRSVRRRLRFLRHLFFFAAVGGFLVLIDWLTGGSGSGVNWAHWVVLIWGAIVALEFVSNFVAPQVWGREAEERMVRREMRRRRDA